MKQLPIVFLALLVAQPVALAQDASRAPAPERTAECQAAIRAELEPIRKKKVDECVASKERENRAACERFYSDYGKRKNNKVVSFDYLPECAKVSPHRLQEAPARAEQPPAPVQQQPARANQPAPAKAPARVNQPVQADSQPTSQTGAEILTGREVIKQPQQRQVIERGQTRQVTTPSSSRPVTNQPAQRSVTSGTEGRNVTNKPGERNVTK